MYRKSEWPLASHLTTALVVAIVSRIALFFGSMVVPIPNESGMPISPLMANSALDLSYYMWAAEMYFGETQLVIDTFVRFFTGNETSHFFLPGPLYPILLRILDYGPGNTLPMSFLFLALSSLLAAGWLWWLWRNGMGSIWLYIFAVLPTPYWFMLNISTDLLFASVIGAFWLVWFDRRPRDKRMMSGIATLAVIACLLRPNAISLLLFLCAHVTICEVALKDSGPARRDGFCFAAFLTILLCVITVFYLPYFHWVLTHSGGSHYFGRSPAQYVDGLWPDLPTVFNLGLSWSALLAAKVLYLTGLRPSFGDTAVPLVFLRLLPGIIMLPGLFWLLLRAEWAVRLFVLFFLAPILLGVSQDRYVLPIQPVLFLFGAKAWVEIVQLCRKHSSVTM